MPGKPGMDRVENFRLWPGNPLPSPLVPEPVEGEREGTGRENETRLIL